jgi:hypothetical protein
MDTEFLKSLLPSPVTEYRKLPVCPHCGSKKRSDECDTCNQEMAEDLARACDFAGCQLCDVE